MSTFNYDVNNFLGQPSADSKNIKIFDKYFNFKYNINVLISFYYYKDRFVYIKSENSNDVTLDFESTTHAIQALGLLNDAKKIIAEQVSETTDYYTITEIELGALNHIYFTSGETLELISEINHLSGLTDVQLSAVTNGEVLTYNNGLWINSSFTYSFNFDDLSAFTNNYYTTSQTYSIDQLSSSTSNVYINWNHIINSPTGATGYGITDVYTTAQTYSKLELNPNPGSPEGSSELDDRYYTKLQTFDKEEMIANFLSSTTSFYSEAETNANFLSANTSYYEQQYIDDNLSLTSHTHDYYSLTSHTHDEYSLTSHTHDEYSLTSHTHTDFSLSSHTHDLSALTNTAHTHLWNDISNTSHTHLWSNISNTSHTHADIYYTKTELKTDGELDDRYYTKLQTYTKPEIDANFLSANTSFYSQSEVNANFLSASTIDLFDEYSLTSHTHTLATLSGVTITTPQNRDFLLYDNGYWVNSAVSFDVSNFYTKGELDSGVLNDLYISLSGTTGITGHLVPAEDGVYDLGSATRQWRSLYVSASTIYVDGYPITVVDGQLIVDGQPMATTASTSEQYSLTSHTHTQYSITGHSHDDRYYTKLQSYNKEEVDDIITATTALYYTSAQTNANFLSANTSYYTQNQVNNLLTATTINYSLTSHTHYFSGLTNTAHTHLWTDISNTSHTHDERYYTESEVNNLISGFALNSNLTAHTSATGVTNPHQIAFNDLTSTSHTHADIYYTKTELKTDGELDDRYYTKLQTYTKPEVDGLISSGATSFFTSAQTIDNFLSASTSFYTTAQTIAILQSYSITSHTHDFSGLTNTAHTHLWSDISNTSHTHDERYYTETELNSGQLDNRYYTTAQTYTTTQTDNNFLSANTSFYTTAQTNTILLGYTTTSHTHALSGLTDVTISSLSQDQILIYSAGTWKNTDLIDIDLDMSQYYTSAQTDVILLGYSTTAHTHDFSGLTNTAHTHLWTDISNTSHTHDIYSLTSHTLHIY